MNNVLDFEYKITAHGNIGSPNRQFTVSCEYENGTWKQYHMTFKSRNEAHEFVQALERGDIRAVKYDWI